MTTFVPIIGKLLAYGLTWVTISQPKKESSESTALSRAAQAEYRVRYAGRTGNEIKYGLARHVIDEIGDQPKGTVLSVALLFSEYMAAHNPPENSLLVMQLDDKKVAMIALLKGTPYLDIVVPLNELDGQLTSLYQEGHAAFVVYGNLPAYAKHVISANDLMSGNTRLAALVRFTDPVKKVQRIGLIVIVIGLIGGFANWKITKARQEMEAAAKRIVSPVQLYKENSQRLLANTNFNGEEAASTIWKIIKDREINIAGWSLKTIQCNSTQCKELWQQQGGDFNALREQTHPSQIITLQANGDTSVIAYPLAGQHTALERSTLPKKEALWTDLMMQQQRFERISPALLITLKPADVRGLTPAMMVSSIPTDLLIYSGEINVRAPLGLAADLLRNHLKNVMINEIVLDGFDDVRRATIQIKGTYYAQH